MKQLAVLLAAALSLMLVAPALAQPFADVPTDHWAYDAIAELAAKGLIEGYPDGLFRGDRAATRYEMAMVVARLLARIEAIKIPPLPSDLVRTAQLNAAQAANAAARQAIDQRLTAKLATIQRLVAEFRAELAALGVRVTAVEEELAAIRARLDNTKVTGDMRFRGNWFPPNTAAGGATQRSPDWRLRARVLFTGSIGPQTQAVVRLRADNGAGFDGSFADTAFGSGVRWNGVGFDLLYFDYKKALGAELYRLGRQYYSIGDQYGGGLNGGLLFDPADSSACGSTAGAIFGGPNGVPYCTPGTIDGLRADFLLGPIPLTIGLWRDENWPGTFTSQVGVRAPYYDYQTIRATTGALIPGWTLGFTYYNQGSTAFTPPAVSFAGRGWGFDFDGTLMPGMRLYLDWASWQPRVQNGSGTLFTWASTTAWRVGGNFDLEKLLGLHTWSPSFDLIYQSYGAAACNLDPTGVPPAGYSTNCPFGQGPPPWYTYATTSWFQAFAWNQHSWLAKLNLTFTPKFSFFAQYTGGTETISYNSFYEWWVRFSYVLSPRTNTYIQWTKGSCGNQALCNASTVLPGDLGSQYRAELSYSW